MAESSDFLADDVVADIRGELQLPPKDLGVRDVVAEIRVELGLPLNARSETPPLAPLGRARELMRRFRAEPVGGRLAPLKRLAFWWVASAFDRQSKVIEAMIAELEGGARRIQDLEARLAKLESGTRSGGSRPKP
jgi:hypothetical protein